MKMDEMSAGRGAAPKSDWEPRLAWSSTDGPFRTVRTVRHSSHETACEVLQHMSGQWIASVLNADGGWRTQYFGGGEAAMRWCEEQPEVAGLVPSDDELYRRGLCRDLEVCGQAIVELSEQMRDGDDTVRDNATQALATRIGEMLDIAQCIEDPRRPHWADSEHLHHAASGALSVIVSGLVSQAMWFALHERGDSGNALRMLDELDQASRLCRAYLREVRRREEANRER